MADYPKKIARIAFQPVNSGIIAKPNSVGICVSFACGSAVKFYLQIAEKKIIGAKFQTNGCGYAIATADILVESILQQQLSDLDGLAHLTGQIENKLGKFPDSRLHCQRLTIDALQAAFRDYRTSKLTDWNGEKALICTCFGISEETIEKIVTENDCRTIEELSGKCRAGTGCGSCQPLILDILDNQVSSEF